MKKIIHIDADCFYASVEMRENPELISLPIAVGGSPEKRGVIATCNYEARKFGIRSAMSSAVARKICPHLRFISPRIALYKEYSTLMRRIFSEYSTRIEPLSLDEAYLDVSESGKHSGSATLIAREIKQRIKSELGISVSAGVASAKFLAKIASDWKKPDGLFVIDPRQVEGFVRHLDVRKLPGVGPVTAEKMMRRGIYTCCDIQRYGLDELLRYFGVYGARLHKMSLGIDDGEVHPDHDRKSISVERTFESDYSQVDQLLTALNELLLQLERRYEKVSASQKIHKFFIKVRFSDFSITTNETTVRGGRIGKKELFERLLYAAWRRKNMPVRLLGVGYRLQVASEMQLEFDFGGN